ncbi:MAG: hypothetical protein GY839_09345 [candidate division Zixibacteria bacterium]|nr:hypothetical protein [candidate division Zixibacteria bacterium]
MKIIPALILVALLLIFRPVYSVVINIPGDYPTIQDGINSAGDNDTVLVQPGRYYENIHFIGINITLGSLFLTTGDISYVTTTIIDGDSEGPVIGIGAGEDSTTVISGFTIQNGYAENGGGINCRSNPRLEYLNIVDNFASNGGGGVDVFGATPKLSNCIILRNHAGNYGGGMSNDMASLSMNGCVVAYNSTDGYAGGISNYTYSDITMADCVVYGNIAESGGGVWNGGSYPTIVNSILWDNIPNQLSGSESTVTFCDIRGGWNGEGNIDCDPMYCNPAEGNFLLADISCCIGAGEGGTDIGALGVGCFAREYFPGDVNMYNGSWPPLAIGGDVTYLVNYFRGFSSSQPCYFDSLWCSADVNGDCQVIGSDVTRFVKFCRCEGNIIYCSEHPPMWPRSDDLPPEAPEGWPGCEE